MVIIHQNKLEESSSQKEGVKIRPSFWYQMAPSRALARGIILKCRQVLSPARIARPVSTHAPLPKWAKILMTLKVFNLSLANDSQACRESARQVLGDSERPSPSPRLDATFRARTCASPQVGQNPVTLKVCNPWPSNHSQACHEFPHHVFRRF